jgi:hypothetical protein
MMAADAIRPLRSDAPLPARLGDDDAVPPVRLDQAIEAAAATETDPAILAQIEQFESMLRAADAPFAAPGLDAMLANFAMPTLRDPGILVRSLDLLEAIGLAIEADGTGGDVLQIGGGVVRDELRKQRLLQQNRNGLIEA